jgi:acetylaranotin biosynthesis cluster protein L
LRERAGRHRISKTIRNDANDDSNSPSGGSMIYVSKEVRANGDAGQPRLSRSEIWKGLVMKAENALPFVPGMAKCDVVERTADGLVRDIVFRGEDAREKITFYPEEKVVFLRLSGNVDGFIVNEILGDDNDLRLRFSFALQLVDAPSDSAEEKEFRALMEREYLRAVDATLAAIRKLVSEPQPAT